MESLVYWFKSKTASMIFEVTQRQSQYSWGGQKFIFWFLIVMWSSCFLKRPQKLMKSSSSIWHYLTGLLQGGARGHKPPPPTPVLSQPGGTFSPPSTTSPPPLEFSDLATALSSQHSSVHSHIKKSIYLVDPSTIFFKNIFEIWQNLRIT